MLTIGMRELDAVYLFTSDGPVRVELVRERRDGARVGFKAPLSIEIYREKVLPPERRAQLEAAGML